MIYLFIYYLFTYLFSTHDTAPVARRGHAHVTEAQAEETLVDAHLVSSGLNEAWDKRVICRMKARTGRRGEEEAVLNDWLGFMFSLSTTTTPGQGIRIPGCVDGKKRCEDGDGEREHMTNRKQSVPRVKGQPPESVNAVTVGTDQSQCRSDIDQIWAHAQHSF